MAAKTICFINQKGGCGKSSACFHLAGQLARLQQRVLLVDADPQGSLSQGFLGSQLVENYRCEATLASAMSGVSGGCLSNLVLQTPFSKIDLIPANQHLAEFNVPSPERLGLQQFALFALLEQACEYDVILIDCPPNLYACTWNALIASDYVVIPVPPEDFGTQGLLAVHQAVEEARSLNVRLAILGMLISRKDKRLLVHQVYERKLREIYAEEVLTTVIPEASAFKIAIAKRQPVGLSFPESKAASSMAALASELLVRMHQTCKKWSVG